MGKIIDLNNKQSPKYDRENYKEEVVLTEGSGDKVTFARRVQPDHIGSRKLIVLPGSKSDPVRLTKSKPETKPLLKVEKIKRREEPVKKKEPIIAETIEIEEDQVEEQVVEPIGELTEPEPQTEPFVKEVIFVEDIAELAGIENLKEDIEKLESEASINAEDEDGITIILERVNEDKK